MITKEIYLEYARRNEVPMYLLWEYYQKLNTRPELNMSLEEFDEYFTQFLHNFAAYINLEPVRAYYDRFYGITTVYNKQGNLVKIY